MKVRKFLAVVFTVLMCAGPLFATDSALSLVQQHLSSKTSVAKAKKAQLEAAVRAAVRENPEMAGAIVGEVLSVARNDMDEIVGGIVRAAIQGLGPNPSEDLIREIVGVAITYRPTAALRITAAAVSESPRSAAPGIVNVAVSSLPSANAEIAAAIVQAATLARPGLDTAALNAAAQRGLYGLSAGDGKEVADYKGGKEALPPVGELLDIPTGDLSLVALDAGVPVEEFPRLVLPPVASP